MGHFTFWISPSLSGIAERNRCAVTHMPQGVIIVGIHVLKYLLLIVIILKQKGVMQTFKRNIFAKLSRLDVCKPTNQHHSFLL